MGFVIDLSPDEEADLHRVGIPVAAFVRARLFAAVGDAPPSDPPDVTGTPPTRAEILDELTRFSEENETYSRVPPLERLRPR